MTSPTTGEARLLAGGAILHAISTGSAGRLRRHGVTCGLSNPEEGAMSDQIEPWPRLKRGSRGHPFPALQYLLRHRAGPLTWRALVSGPLSG